MTLGVLDQIAEGTFEGGPVAANHHRLGVHDDPLRSHVLCELVERDLLGRRRCALLSRQREQVVRELGKSLGVGLEVGDERRCRAVAREVLDVAPQRCERRAELV